MKTRTRYTDAQLLQFSIDDQLRDAAAAERQAAEGPFYPDRDITRESLLAYAAECRATAARLAQS